MKMNYLFVEFFTDDTIDKVMKKLYTKIGLSMEQLFNV
jgi:hypothetical protein